MPQLVYEEDVPEVRMPKKPPKKGNIRDLQEYCGSLTIELERLEEQLEIYKDILKRGTF
jgi:hypothetical protein